MPRTILHITEILAWADAFQDRWGRWPKRTDGRIPGTPDLTWCGIDQALAKGHRGLLPGSSLARLLHEHRGVRHRNQLPRLTHRAILGWADTHRERTGEWPNCWSGPIQGAAGETWLGIDKALRAGRRGLPGGSSLGLLLAARLGVRNNTNVPSLRPSQVLSWVDAHRRRTGKWPTRKSGRILLSGGETWGGVDAALVAGSRGLACAEPPRFFTDHAQATKTQPASFLGT